MFSSNIGSEHFVGLAGAGASSGIVLVLYEWFVSLREQLEFCLFFFFFFWRGGSIFIFKLRFVFVLSLKEQLIYCLFLFLERVGSRRRLGEGVFIFIYELRFVFVCRCCWVFFSEGCGGCVELNALVFLFDFVTQRR